MELERYHELRQLLQQWRLRLAESIRRRVENDPRTLGRLDQIHEGEGVGEEFTLWLDRWCRQAAIQYILRILFLRVLEDRDLLGAQRIRHTDSQCMWQELARNLGTAHYVQWCFWDAAHLLPDLFGPNDYDLVLPDDELVQRFLDEVWRRQDADRPEWLRFDFRPERAGGFQTRFIGDLYQELDAEIREQYALLQTPHFIAEFLLEHTLLVRFEEKDFREVTLIDPTCGSGHILIDAFWHFVARYENDLVSGTTTDHRPPTADDGPRTTQHATRSSLLTPAQRVEIARTIIETPLYGCDINPYATALTRFRLLLAVYDYAHPTSLADLRDLHFNVVTIDSLIPYEKMIVGGAQRGQVAQVLGQPEAIERALPVLRKRYDVVVGNPPYISPPDAAKRELYRENYKSAYRGYGLSAPFTERFLQLGANGARVGLINSNAIATRLFGQKLIEEVLPMYDLEAVIDLSGVYIPGHRTPTLIIIARCDSPSSKQVKLLSNLRGEPDIPSDPSRGKVWKSVLSGLKAEPPYQDEFIDIALRPRSVIAQHPWKFGGPASRLAEKLEQTSEKRLSGLLEANGRDVHSGLNDVYYTRLDFFRRIGIEPRYLLPIVTGSDIRDWAIDFDDYALFPYIIQDELKPASLSQDSPIY